MSPSSGRRVLTAVTTAQLMIGVDATILAMAVSSMKADLGLSPEGLAWVMAGYVLAAGSLMIAFGRVAQAIGYVPMMNIGLAAFGVASITAGAAGSEPLLICARVAQGVGAAAITPAAMARLSAAFTGEARAKAYGTFGMIMGSGTAIGLILGGVLTQVSSWRACMFVNVPFVAVALAASITAKDQHPHQRGASGGWWRGALLAVSAGSLIQALTLTSSPEAAWPFAVAATATLALFVLADSKSSQPLVPVALFTHPSRRAAYLGLFMWGVATINTFVSTSARLQEEHSMDPVTVGALFLVYPAAIQLGLLVTRRLGPRNTGSHIAVGLSIIGVGQGFLALAPNGPLSTFIALALMGLGTSQVMPHANSAMNRDAGEHAGVAGGIGTTLQQLGGSIGLALPVALSAATDAPQTLAAGIAAIALTATALMTALAMRGHQ